MLETEKAPLVDLGPGVPTFEDFFSSKIPTIKEVQSLLAQALSNDPMEMEAQIRQIEAKLGSLKCCEAFADSYLDASEREALVKIGPRTKDFTDLDREKALAGAVLRERRFRDVCRAIVESIETRISFGQSRLRFIERNNG